jgi:hypothetical protein
MSWRRRPRGERFPDAAIADFRYRRSKKQHLQQLVMPVIPKVIHRLVISSGLRVKGGLSPILVRTARIYDYAHDVEKACSPAEAHSAFSLIWQPVNRKDTAPPGAAMAPGPPGRKAGRHASRGDDKVTAAFA